MDNCKNQNAFKVIFIFNSQKPKDMFSLQARNNKKVRIRKHLHWHSSSFIEFRQNCSATLIYTILSIIKLQIVFNIFIDTQTNRDAMTDIFIVNCTNKDAIKHDLIDNYADKNLCVYGLWREFKTDFFIAGLFKQGEVGQRCVLFERKFYMNGCFFYEWMFYYDWILFMNEWMI